MTAQSRVQKKQKRKTAVPARAPTGPTQPAGAALAELETSVRDHLDDHVDQVVRRIAGAIPSLGRDSTVPLHELRSAVNCVLRSSLTMLVHERAAEEDDIARWRMVSTRSANLGVPLDDVLQGLRICATTLWEALSSVAVRLAGTHPFEVLEQAPRLWLNYDLMASVVTEAHQHVGSAMQIEHSQRVCAFLTALRRLPAEQAAAETLARGLGLDPNGWFVAVVHANTGAKLDTSAIRAVVADQTYRTVTLLQLPCSPPEGEEQAAWLLDAAGCTPAGIGIQRSGLAGAQQALLDAEAAFQAAVELHLPIVKFRARWLTCLSLQHRGQHETLVEPAVSSLRQDAQLRATVAAYLHAEGSLPGAAALLGLHANTVAYRLRQMADRTGLDARSAAGAALARMALTFAETDVAQWETVHPPVPAPGLPDRVVGAAAS